MVADRNSQIVWANDKALQLHGVRTLAALGPDPVDYRKRFSLHYQNGHKVAARRYPVERLKQGESFEDVCVHLTSQDEPDLHKMLNIQGICTPNEDGVAGILILRDETEKFEAQERFERAFDVNPAPAIICRLTDLRYIKVNTGFVQMMGHSPQALLGRSVYEIDILREASDRDQAIESLQEGEAIAQMEAVLKHAEGHDKHVIVAGQPIDVDEEPCMLFTFIDLTSRKQAEERTRQSEERFSTAFRLAPVPMALATPENDRLLEVNDAFLQVSGFSSLDEINETLQSQPLWIDPRSREALPRGAAHTGGLRNVELQMRLKTGQLVDCLASAEAASIGDTPYTLWVIQDISQRKRTEAELMLAIETVMQDASWFSRTVVEKLAQLRGRQPGGARQPELADLTQREQEILNLLCQGKDDTEVGKTLSISKHTVRNHVAAIYNKIGVHRRAAAIVWALERGLGGS